MKFRGMLIALMMCMAVPLGAGERLTLRVSPSVSFAPANLIVRAMVEADAANRSMEIVAESSDFYRSSEVQLDGERAPHTTVFEFKSMPVGTYVVRATLVGADGQMLASVHSQVDVIDTGVGQ